MQQRYFRRLRVNKLLVSLFLLGLIFYFMSACSGSYRRKMMAETKTFELNRFLGQWYEIARYPHRFEKGLSHVTATYSLMPSGKIEVLNKGFEGGKTGTLKKAVGKAKSASDNGKGHLRVSFFWIFYADYFIVELDEENYSYAMIGSSSPNYFWILSRTPRLPADTLEKLLQRASLLGYDKDRMEWVAQD